MSHPRSLPTLRRQLLTELPGGAVDPARAAEFAESFGSAVVEAADIAALLIGTVPAADLAGAVENMARAVVGAIDTAGDLTGLAGHAWIAQAQCWAVGAFFDRITEVSRATPAGGRA